MTTSTTQRILKSIRESGMTQAAIHKETKIPQSRLSKWENGKVPRSADDALALQELLAQRQKAA